MNALLNEITEKTDKMDLIELANYIETLRMALLCGDVYHEIEEEIEYLHDKKGEPFAHMCTALSHLDLAEQALRLAHYAKFRR
jgi:hypothetical protein